jgi:hypothetical protein
VYTPPWNKKTSRPTASLVSEEENDAPDGIQAVRLKFDTVSPNKGKILVQAKENKSPNRAKSGDVAKVLHGESFTHALLVRRKLQNTSLCLAQRYQQTIHTLTLHCVCVYVVHVTVGPRQAPLSVKMESGQVTSPAKPTFSPVLAHNMRSCAPPSTRDKRLCSFIEGIAEKAAISLTVVNACREAQRTLVCMERETMETILPALSERALRFAWPRAWKTDGVSSKATGVCMEGSRMFAGETDQLLTSLMEAVKESDELDNHVRLLKAAADGSGKAVSVYG